MSTSTTLDSGRSQYLVVLPTYNEREALPIIVHRTLEASNNVDVLVIDDSSPDGTAAIAQEIRATTPRVDIIVRPGKLGLGSAYILGFEYGIANDYRGVCTMDADNSHDPMLLPKMIEAMQLYDVIIGSRYIGGGRTNQSLLRRVNSTIANALARLALELPIRDCTSGYRMYSTDILRALPLQSLQSRGYSMLVELLCDTLEAGGRVTELPISFIDRRLGQSKIGAHEMWESVRTMARLRRGRFGPFRTQVANALYNLLFFANKNARTGRNK